MADMFKVAEADTAVVGELMERLMVVFNEFILEMARRSGRGLEYMDGFMVAHNFHKAIVLDLEERYGKDIGPDRAHALRRMAVDTLIAGLGLEHFYRYRDPRRAT